MITFKIWKNDKTRWSNLVFYVKN